MNDLQGFPIAIFVHEVTLNRMLHELCTTGNHFATAIHAKNSLWDFKIDEMQPPTVDFNTDIKQGCRLKFTIKRGVFESWVLPPGATQMIQKRVALDGITFSLTTPMKLVWQSYTPDFGGHALLTDLTQVRDVRFDLPEEIHVEILSQTPQGAAQGVVDLQELIRTRIAELAHQGKGDLPLGFVNVPTTAAGYQMFGPLAPTSCGFSTYRVDDAQGNYQHGYLIYLPLLDNQPPPRGDAVGVFNRDWAGGYQGITQVISDGVIFEKFIGPALQQAFPYAQFGLKRGDAETGSRALISLVAPFDFYAAGHRSTMHTLNCCTIDLANGGNLISIDYQFNATISHWSGDNHAAATGQLTIRFACVDNVIHTQVNAPPPAIRDTGQSTGEKIGRFFGDLFTFGGDEALRASDFSDVAAGMAQVGMAIAPYLRFGFRAFSLPGPASFIYDAAWIDGPLLLRGYYQ